MKKYFADTNIFLRFLLKDNHKLHQKAEKYLLQAKKGEIKITLLPEVVFEIDYVLRGIYATTRQETAHILASLIKASELDVRERGILIEALEKYKKINVDLFDIYLAQKAKAEKAEILSFDKDFNKLK